MKHPSLLMLLGALALSLLAHPTLSSAQNRPDPAPRAPAGSSDEAIPAREALTWTDSAGTPITNLQIRLIRNARPTLEFITNAKGQTWRMQGESYQAILLTHHAFTMQLPAGQTEVFENDGLVKLPFSITPDKPNDVTGTVLAPDGKPLSNTRVRIAGATFEGGGSSPYSLKWLSTRPDGTFGFSAQATLKSNPAAAKNLVFHVDVLEPSITGPIPQRARIQMGAPKTITLEKPPVRNIVLADFDGKPLSPAACAAALIDATLHHQTSALIEAEGSVRVPLESLDSLPLPSGKFTLYSSVGQFGPAVLTTDKPGDLILKAPKPALTRLTVLDGLTGKPAAGKTIIVATTQFSDPSFFAYLTLVQWQQVLAVKSPEDVALLRDEPYRWFENLNKSFAVLTTSSEGVVDINLPRRGAMDALYAMTLGKDDYPLFTRISTQRISENEIVLPQTATLYRFPIATLLVKPPRPAGQASRSRNRSPYNTTLTLAPDASPQIRAAFPQSTWAIQNVEADVVNRLLLPAGVPLTFAIHAPGNQGYQSPVLDLAAGQVRELEDPSFAHRIKYSLRFADSDGASLPGVAIFMKRSDGQFKPVGSDPQSSEFWVELEGYGTHTFGFLAPWQAPAETPLYQAKFTLDKDTQTNFATVKFDIQRTRLELISRLSQIPAITFTDAFGKPMPKGTAFSLPGGRSVPSTAVLDDKGSIPGSTFAKFFENGLIISHPDCGSAVINDQYYGSIEWKRPQPVPLADRKTADKAFLSSGKVIDSDGHPMSNLRVMAGVPWFTSAHAYYSLRDEAIQPITAADGTFAVYPLCINLQPETIAKVRASNFENANIAVSSEDPWIFGYNGPAKIGESQTITIIRAKKAYTLQIPEVDGRRPSLSGKRVTFKPTSQETPYLLPQGYFSSTKPIPLAYGTYTLDGGFTPLVIDGLTPDIVPLNRPVVGATFVSGSIVDYLTGKPIPDALVIGTSWMQSTGQERPLPPDFWLNVSKLPTPFNADREFSREFIIDTRASTGTRTDAKGLFLLPKAKDSNDVSSAGHVSMYVMAKGFLPMIPYFETSKLNKKGNTFDFPPVKLFPAASVTLQLDDYPPVSAFPDKNATAHIHFQFPSDITLEPQNQMGRPLHLQMDLPYNVKSANRTVSLPADVPVRLFLNTYYSNDPPKPGVDYPAWETVSDKPVTFKPGEETTLKFKRVKQIPVTFKVLTPDGKPIDLLMVGWFIAQNPDFKWIFDLKTDPQGLITLLLPASRKSTLYLGSRHLNDANLLVEYQAPDVSPKDPVVITLTKSQWDTLRARMR